MYNSTPPNGYNGGTNNPWSSGATPPPIPPGGFGRIGERREPGLVLILSLLTCGIYYLWWIAEVSKETQEFLNEPDTSPTMEVVLTLVTCGIYNIYWDYKMGKKIARMQGAVGMTPTDNSVLYLVLDLLGVGVVNGLMEQGALNDVWYRAAQAMPNAQRY